MSDGIDRRVVARSLATRYLVGYLNECVDQGIAPGVAIPALTQRVEELEAFHVAAAQMEDEVISKLRRALLEGAYL